MAGKGWESLLKGWPWYGKKKSFSLAAYSEFLPPPLLGRKPYGDLELLPFRQEDPHRWHITEYEEQLELLPGLARIAQEVGNALVRLGTGQRMHGIARAKLANNPYWPEQLASRVGRLPHERYIMLLPLALSRTQDDKGRVRWTLFGSSEQGPARGFWRGFFEAPGQEIAEEASLIFFRQLLASAYGEKGENLLKCGLRILPMGDPGSGFSHWREEPLPSWTRPLLWSAEQTLKGVKYLLTFRAFASLPESVRAAYLAGSLHLLPFPGSLIFWGAPIVARMSLEFPFAAQLPLQHLVGRAEDLRGIRVPQSGWFREARPGVVMPDEAPGPLNETFRRTHRWGKVHRHENELATDGHDDKVTRVLFSSRADDCGLYGKPMARNSQLFTHNYQLLLDGPQASFEDLVRAVNEVDRGGLFGYRFQYPAMRVGKHEVFWHRPLCAFRDAGADRTKLLPSAPLGFLTAYQAEAPNLDTPTELWPSLLKREPHLAGLSLLNGADTIHPYQTIANIRKLLESYSLMNDQPLPRSLARSLLATAKAETLDSWMAKLIHKTSNQEEAARIVAKYAAIVEPAPRKPPKPLTFARTATRAFEIGYWKKIAFLAEGQFITKNNADCVDDKPTQENLVHRNRDLDPLGDYLLSYYRDVVAKAGMGRRALVGDLPFRWETEFDYPWMGGWVKNQAKSGHERDLIVVIPGRDRKRAVVMSDHYDTAYMLDRFDPRFGGVGARLAAAGADDNYSATAAMMQAAPIFLDLSRAGKLACDIWLIHLTGEEFPADCLGARFLCKALVEGSLSMRTASGKSHNLSGTRVQGIYVADMIAHNNDRDRDTFQMSPGAGQASFWLAYQAHLAAEAWNAGVPKWNQRPARRGRGRGQRSADGKAMPAIARHPLLYGEVRPQNDPRSTLYNTDGQIFSDAGIPVVLFMENYDINRTGYHDTHDTMENIDLDFGAAVAAIFIESVARAATEEPLSF